LNNALLQSEQHCGAVGLTPLGSTGALQDAIDGEDAQVVASAPFSDGLATLFKLAPHLFGGLDLLLFHGMLVCNVLNQCVQVYRHRQLNASKSVMENPKATEVFERLKEALKLPSDVELAQALGLAYQAFSKRKLRNSLPREEVETLVEQHQLCHEWVFAGTGPMYEGGEAQEKRVRDFDDLVAQIHAMSLHNQVSSVVETLVRGVVWGDKAKVQKVVRDLSKLSPDEQQLVAAYRLANESVRSAIDLILAGGKSQAAITQTFHGSVGQTVAGDAHGQTFHLHDNKAVYEVKKPRK
jgi:hypothetical protein